MRKEYNLKKLKSKPKDPSKFQETKVATNVRLDVDVVAWLREESEKTAIPYQTLLNSKLKQAMTDSKNKIINVDQVRTIVKEELDKLAS